MCCRRADTTGTNEFDAIIIGSGLGGLSCAAAFARQGFKVLVLEQHDKAGGYATSFKRPGGFEFDVSLHSTGVGERNGIHNLIPGFPELTSVDFVPHPTLYRAIFPEHDVRVPNRNLPDYVAYLKKSFPPESQQIDALFLEIGQLTDELGRLSASNGKIDYSRFPDRLPNRISLFRQHMGTDCRCQAARSQTERNRVSTVGMPIARHQNWPASITLRLCILT